LFNVISAIFVESTMKAASNIEIAKRRARFNDPAVWSSGMFTVLQRLLALTGHEFDRLSEHVDEISALKIPVELVTVLHEDAEAMAAMNDLDIEPADVERLGDILDPDQGGDVLIVEFVEGLQRLRGPPRRSDVVAIDLMVRSLQRSVAGIHGTVGAPEVPKVNEKSSIFAKQKSRSFAVLSHVDVRSSPANAGISNGWLHGSYATELQRLESSCARSSPL